MQNVEVVMQAEPVFRFYQEKLKRQESCTLTRADFAVMQRAFNAMRPAVTGQPASWMLSVPVLSTGHLTEATARMLTVHSLRRPFGVDVAAFADGLFYHTSLTLPGMPADLKAIHAWAEKHDVPWLCFDADGVFVPELPHYEWEAEVERMEQADRYLLWMQGDVEPALQGPFHSDEARVVAARELHEGEGQEDGLFRLDVTSGAKVMVEVLTGAELASAVA